MFSEHTETDYAVPTGEFIEEWLDDNDLSQAELSRRMGVSAKHVSKLIHGGVPLTPDVALKLSLVTGVPQEHWMTLEATYRADVSRLSAQEQFAAEHLDLLKEFSAAATHLRKRGFISTDANMRNPGLLLLELLSFFKVGAPELLRSATQVHVAAFRNSPAHASVNASVATWLRLGAFQMESREPLEPFDLLRAKSAIDRVAQISGHESTLWMDEIEATLKSGGIEVAYVDSVKGCRAYGATQWIRERPLVQLSLRGRNDGQFWFTLMHELGHVVLQPQVDVMDLDADASGRFEDAANEFAMDRLIPEAFREGLSELATEAEVRHLAQRLGISTGVVVGQLHRHKCWPYTKGQNLYVKVIHGPDVPD